MEGGWAWHGRLGCWREFGGICEMKAKEAEDDSMSESSGPDAMSMWWSC